MVNSPTHGCLEPEVLAAYADHGLSLAERAGVETHLASCPQCTALLAGVVRTAAELGIPDTDLVAEGMHEPSRRAVVGGLAAAAAVIAVLAVPPLVGPWLERDTGLVSLAGSVGEHRSVLGRLSGGFPHAPLPVPSAGGQDAQANRTGTDRVLLTSGRIRESFGDFETPSRLHTAGVAHLLSRRYDEAAQLLLAASREQPANARYLNDVATVHLERARLGLRPDDLPRALAAAERATRLDPSLREAWFNRALAVSALSLTDQARTAWTDYLRRDGSSPWAGEARARLEELARPTPAAAWEAAAARLEQSIDAASADAAVRAQTTEARNFIEQELFVDWANAVLAGHSGSAELDRLRVMAEAMLRVAGDALYRDAVAAIDGAAGASSVRTLAAAHLHYADAASRFAQDQHAVAAPLLMAARQQLAAAGSPYQFRAALDHAAADYFLGNAAAAAPLLQEILSAAQQANYRFVAGRSTWQQGLAAFQQGRLSDARTHYEDTLATFVAMGDVEQRSSAHGLLAVLFLSLGDRTEEWRHRNAALEGLAVSTSPRFRYGMLAAAAFSVRFEAPDAALLIQASALATAREWGRDAAIADILAQRSATLLALGRIDEAEAGIAEARQRLNAVPDLAFRRIFELPVLAIESDLLRRRDPQQSAAVALKAIDTAKARNENSRLPQFQLRLAKARIASNQLGLAEQALADGIAAFDATRATPVNALGISAQDEAWQLFETAVRLAVHRGDFELAFALNERGRAHIPDSAARRLRIPSLGDMQAALQPDEAVISVTQFDDELAVWVIRNQGTNVVLQPMRRADARRIVARQQDEIRLQSAPGASAVLFDVIVRPVTGQLSGVRRITFVPDATYQDASMAAFWDRLGSRFAVETWTLAGSPSVSTFYTVLGHAASVSASSSAAPNSVLLMSADADPARVAPIAQHYRSAELLTGQNATRAKLLAGATVMHVAAPSYRNDQYPSLSRLVLNDEAGRRYTGAVMSHDIARHSMRTTRLVVLDELRTEPSYRTAGTLDLATAFLAAGVPAVLGTLPGAEESATRELMVGFHRELAAQASPAEALSRVQRNALQQNGRRLGAWTALVMYGSDR